MLAHKELIFILVGLIVVVIIKGDSNLCPRFCKCDLYNELNRATCSAKKLISAEVEAPKVVQILDLSYNEITTIERTTFMKYYHLRILDLSHNAIQILDLDAFSQLKRLQEIDLSHNRLESLDERLFEQNHRLTKLNLEGNKFMSISIKPLLKSKTLIDLSLKNSQIIFIHSSMFSKLPNLQHLDLSENLLNNLRFENFIELKQLKNVQLSENPLNCDPSLKDKLKVLENHGIHAVIDQCQETTESGDSFAGEKFQKLSMPEPILPPVANSIEQWHLDLDSQDKMETEVDYYDEDGTDDNLGLKLENNEWLRFAPDAVLCEIQKPQLCKNYRKCLVNFNNIWHEKRTLESFTSNEAKFSFLLGAACGITAVVSLLTCGLCVKNCCEKKKRDRLPDLETTSTDMGQQPLARPQLPPQVRRQPRRRAAPAPPRAIMRYEGPVAENFLSRLFGRPARHQYYRTINQNTATLIRRLSRSNLFNNRLSQHFVDRQNSTDATTPSAGAEGGNASAPRPETPPPCYGDVIINGCEERMK